MDKKIYLAKVMQEISKFGVDLIFCFIIVFLIVQGSSNNQPDRELMNIWGIDLAGMGIELN